MKGERKMKTAKTGQRRIFGVIASLLILVLTLSVLVGCKPTGEVSDVGTATVVIAVGEDVRSYTVPLDKVDGSVGAIILLDYLKTEGELDYTSVDGIYGAYLTKVGHLEEKFPGEFHDVCGHCIHTVDGADRDDVVIRTFAVLE